jgi:hypothetical protein
MSTISKEKCAIMSVIVRAYRDRPVRLNAHRLSGGSVEVFRDNPARAMGWPERDVYQDDAANYTQLENAWSSGDTKAMNAAWAAAKRLAPSSTH